MAEDFRNEKMTAALRDVAAEFLVREANRNTLITVTAAALSEDHKRGVIYITVFPDSGEAAALAFANRHVWEFGEFFRKRVSGMTVPHIEFQIDKGEKNRQRLDELSK
jgi:ribosome-binding factor A